MIRSITVSDAPAICEIYNHYVDTTAISFEYDSVSIDDMETRIENTISNYPWLVYEEEGEVLAYIYANVWKTREAYKHVLESTIYASKALTTNGVGTSLYEALFEDIEKHQESRKVKSLMAVIALPNEASVGLHKKMGFEEAGYFKDVGYKFDEWIDVAYYQKILLK